MPERTLKIGLLILKAQNIVEILCENNAIGGGCQDFCTGRICHWEAGGLGDCFMLCVLSARQGCPGRAAKAATG